MLLRSELLQSARAPVFWRREALHLAALFMEAPWLIVWFIIIQPGADQLPADVSAGFVVANLVLGLLLLRQAINRNAPASLYRLISLGGAASGIALSTLVIFPLNGIGNQPPFLVHVVALLPPHWLLAGMLVVLLWYRAQAIANDLLTPMRTAFHFRLGIIMMILAGLIGDARIRSVTFTLIPVFFFAGLLATSLARLASLYIARPVQRTTFSGRWFAMNAGLALLLNGLGFILALLLAGISLGGMDSVVQGLLGTISTVLLAILYPFLAIIDAVASWLAERLSGVLAYLSIPDIGNTFATSQRSSALPGQAVIAATLTLIIKIVLIAGIVLAVLLILGRLFRRRDAETSGNNEERERLASHNPLGGVGAGLRNAFSGLQGALNAVLGNQRMLDAMTIRRQYARLSERATALGFPRGDSETPFEYETQLRQAFPGFEDGIHHVTSAYVNVHYGELPDSPGGFAAVKESVDAMLASSQEQLEQSRRSVL